MKVKLSRPAARQLDAILSYIGEQSPSGANKVRSRIREVMDVLGDYPFAGQLTRRHGVRRILILPYPYAMTYRVQGVDIVILGLRHTARRPQNLLSR